MNLRRHSSTGLPEQYAKDYLIAGSTISPDKKFAVIYPTEPYNDIFDFIFGDEDGPVFKLDGNYRVVIDGDATTDPKGISDHRWLARLKAVWDISQGKFRSQKITRVRAKQSH